MSRALAGYRWIIAIAASLLLLGLISVIAYDPEPGEDTGPALRTASNWPSGARALLIWLSDLGYQPETIAFRQFSIDPATRVLFVFQPTHEFAAGDINEIQRWVDGGGVLIVASDHPNALMDAYEASVVRQPLASQRATPLQPVFAQPPVETAQVSGAAWLELHDPEWVALLAPDAEPAHPVLATRAAGAGTVFALSDPFVFSNEAIGEADNAAVILNLLAGIPRGSVVAFDEYHQGLTEHGTLTARITREPWGWAIMYVSLLIPIYLALSGRRFGRATPRSRIAALRSRAEYVATMGAMLRRGNHHDWVRRQYAVQVKRTLGARYGVRADQPAREFVAAVAERGGDVETLGPLLERLETPYPVSEQEAVALMRETDMAQKRITG
jgi:hypothetical protein